MRKHKVIDELKNTHYLKLLEIKEDKKESFVQLFNDKKLKEEGMNDIFILKNHIYKVIKIADIESIEDLNNLYELDILGQGGQGVVYNTRDSDTVIKVAINDEKPIKDPKEIAKFHQKVKELIYKPIPMDINIAMPLSVLEDEAGYVMHLLSGMESFSKLLPSVVSKEEAEQIKIPIPEFLIEFYEKDKRSAFYFAYYLNTGGLRKRLYTLSRIAIVLTRLHSRGLVYCDLSHNNILINNDDIPLVYLIDADNIEYEDITKSGMKTKEYEVPEVLNGEANSLYGDIYSFGILSFITLTTTHPFKGEANAEWDSDKTTTKEQWELPWIEDSNNDSNKSNAGLRANLTITKELDLLFHKLFEDGKNDKFKRPTLPLWIERLEKAATKTIKCDGCDMSYYDDAFTICPYCDKEKPKRIIVKSYYYKNNQKLNEKWYFVKEITDTTKQIELPSYIFKSFDILNIDNIFLQISFARRNRLKFIFNKDNENITFDSKPMSDSRNSSSISKLKQGITIIIEDDKDISSIIEMEIKE